MYRLPKLANSRDSNQTWRKGLFRLGLSLALIAIVYGTADISSLLAALSKISLQTALALMLLYTLGQIISAGKWSLFIRETGLQRNFRRVLRAYFVGMYANTFGLGTVGGDVLRSFLLRPSKGQRTRTLATVAADRVHGLGVLLIIGLFSITIVMPNVLGKYTLPACLLGALALPAAWLFALKILPRIFSDEHRFHQAATKISEGFPASWKTLLQASLISITFHSLQIFMFYLIAQALKVDLSLAYLYATVPFINIASSLPLTINGLGIREAAAVFLFAPAGISQETAIAFGAIWFACVTVISALAGILASDVVGETEFEETSNFSVANAEDKVGARHEAR